MKIAVIHGHPVEGETFCRALGEAYCAAAEAAGHEVTPITLASLDFDPIRRWRFGSGGDENLEPALQHVRETLLDADKWVVVFPLWMGGAPALVKGFWERLLTGGLEGHECEIICTHWWPSWKYWLMGRHGVKALQDMFMLHGIESHITTFGNVDKVPAQRREKWLHTLQERGRAVA